MYIVQYVCSGILLQHGECIHHRPIQLRLLRLQIHRREGHMLHLHHMRYIHHMHYKHHKHHKYHKHHMHYMHPMHLFFFYSVLVSLIVNVDIT